MKIAQVLESKAWKVGQTDRPTRRECPGHNAERTVWGRFDPGDAAAPHILHKILLTYKNALNILRPIKNKYLSTQ